jgi:hypothetical protein
MLNNIIYITIEEVKEVEDIEKIVIQQIHKKISGYKQQDVLKRRYEQEKFVTFEDVVKKMVDCDLKCYYCQKGITLLYDVSREMTQWTIDRIDNDKGHNINNYHLSCLDCNLQRRRRSDEKFCFSKQLTLVKGT